MTNNGDAKTMSGFRHPRHSATLAAMDEAVLKVPADQKFVVLIYDGPQIPGWERKCSWISDAPEGDVKLICKAMADQLNDG